MQNVAFHITSGLPFGREITVNLPNGRAWWTVGTEFEILGQLREADDEDSALIYDFANNMSFVFNEPDEVVVTLSLTGADTRLIKKSGHYDIVMSDTLQADAIAFPILKGQVHRTALVTADTEAPSV